MGLLPEVIDGKIVTEKTPREPESIARFVFEHLRKESKDKVNTLIREENIPLYTALRKLGYLDDKIVCIRK